MNDIRYHAAASLQEAEQLLRSDPAATRLLAGGTDLFGTLKDGIHGDDEKLVLVDLKTIPGLDTVALDHGDLVIGALARVAELASNELVNERVPMLAEAARSVASPQLREMGTVGGNLCQEPRCWYYRYPGDVFHCHRKGGELCAAAVGDGRYHSIFGAARVVDPPCTTACPNDTDIPAYVETLRRLEVGAAARALLAQNPIPAITGRICPHLCETGCNRADLDEPVSIRSLEREVGDYVLDEPSVFLALDAAPTDKNVTIVGSGPAGLTAAYYLRRQGHAVTVLDKESRAGGMLSLGIPPFRLSRDVVDRVLDLYTRLGVQFRLGVEVGRDVSLEEIRESSDAVIVASGAWIAPSIGIEGEDSTVPGLEYLRQAALDEAWRESGTVLVVGGGNVAVDSAMTAMARGAEQVVMVCLESEDEMPAFDWELAEAVAGGVQVRTQWGPRRVRLEAGAVVGVDLVRCSSVFDQDGVFCPTLDESATDFIAADKVILAVGQRVDSHWFKDSIAGADVDATADGVAGGVFVCGDAVSGPATVVEAIASGRRTAAQVHRLLTGADLPVPQPGRAAVGLLDADAESACRSLRALAEMPAGPAADQGATQERLRAAIVSEAKRCLNCSCLAVSPSDLAPALIALNGRIETNRRTLNAAAFFSAPVNGSTVLDHDEIVLTVRIPLPGEGARSVFKKFRARRSTDFPIVNVAVNVRVVDGAVVDAVVCAGAVAPTPIRLYAAESVLIGGRASVEQCSLAASAAVKSTRILGKNAYKRQILQVLVRRSLEEAIGLSAGLSTPATGPLQ